MPPSPASKQKLGLRQVFPNPQDKNQTGEKSFDIIAIHGLDTHSPRTWVAWKNGNQAEGEVNWLQDDHMLPAMLPECRILTYDWNAKIGKDAEVQNLLGHSDKLLDSLRNKRNNEKKYRPILFVASCFGGLLLARALNRAANLGYNYGEIYESTIGAIFLGTPFQGTHEGFTSAAKLRLNIALSSFDQDNGTTSPSSDLEHMELIRYLEAEVQKRSELDDLVDEFYHLIQRETFKKQVECFYETGITDFTNINKHVREHPTFPLRGGNSGVLVPKSSASLPGIDAHGLAVRHSMLSKYDDPEDPDFESVFSSLKRMIEKWESQRHDRVSLEGDPTGQLIFQFFAKSTSGGLADLSIQTTVFKARRLQLPDDSHQQSQWKFMEAASLKTISSLRITRESLTSTVNATATIAKSKVTNSEIGNKYLGEMQGNVNDVSKALQEILLLDSTIDTQSLQGDDFAKLLGVTHAMEAKQQIMETDSVIDVTRLHHKSIQFKKRIERSSRHSFYNASISGTSVLVETFRYDPERSTKTTLSDRRHNSVRRFVYQLSHDRRPIQNVLPCVGYYQEEEKKQVGLVYELGSDAKHISLTELYKKPTKKRTPLGYRLRLAYSLAMGLNGLHRVSWIYKELNSMNIRLIARNLIEGHANASRVDTSWPYPPEGFFFGFEWSRPHNIETDFATPLSSQTRIYRHPDRWLHPREEQKIAQDVYSLGVVLLEIMFWKAATDFTKPDLSGAIRTEIKSRMLTLLESDGPELVGDTFVAVVKTCLNFKELTDGCTPLESYQKFKSEVTEVLARLVGAKI